VPETGVVEGMQVWAEVLDGHWAVLTDDGRWMRVDSRDHARELIAELVAHRTVWAKELVKRGARWPGMSVRRRHQTPPPPPPSRRRVDRGNGLGED